MLSGLHMHAHPHIHTAAPADLGEKWSREVGGCWNDAAPQFSSLLREVTAGAAVQPPEFLPSLALCSFTCFPQVDSFPLETATPSHTSFQITLCPFQTSTGYLSTSHRYLQFNSHEVEFMVSFPDPNMSLFCLLELLCIEQNTSPQAKM